MWRAAKHTDISKKDRVSNANKMQQKVGAEECWFDVFSFGIIGTIYVIMAERKMKDQLS